MVAWAQAVQFGGIAVFVLGIVIGMCADGHPVGLVVAFAVAAFGFAMFTKIGPSMYP